MNNIAATSPTVMLASAWASDRQSCHLIPILDQYEPKAVSKTSPPCGTKHIENFGVFRNGLLMDKLWMKFTIMLKFIKGMFIINESGINAYFNNRISTGQKL